MGRQDQIVNERLRKIKELREQGIEPYPYIYDVKDKTSDLQKKHAKVKNGDKTKSNAKVAGRLISLRDMGKIAFGVLQDGYGRIQITLQKGETPDKSLEFFKKYIDSGDFVGVEGSIFRTQRGELSVLVKEIELLSKAILPLPEKWHGLQNEDDRLRKRYLDITMNPELREMFVRKSKFWQSIRNFLIEREFLEVETPILENVPGGAETRPFITHHNALNADVFLRISPELWLKRLMVAGYQKVFEIGRIFRNEGMDAEHLQDYTQVEFYWAYADYNEGMKMVEEMYKRVAKETYGTTKFKIKDFDIDLDKKWEIYDYAKTIKEMTGVDINKADIKQIEKRLKELDVSYDKVGFNMNRAVDTLWKYCRRKIAGPGFLINLPVYMEPLAKRNRDNPDLVERFQIILAGSELGKGFSELNDPIDQAGRFEEQAKLREEGDEEAQMTDDEFVDALKHAMPPTFGFGVSERLFSFLEGKPIRETVLFPLMKPLASEKETAKNKENKIAVALVNKESAKEPWQQMNTIAHLNAAFGARAGKELLFQDTISTKDDQKIKLNIQHAIMIKETDSSKEILKLIEEAKSLGLEVAEFTKEMIETTSDKKVIESTKSKNYKDIEYLGVLIFGNKTEVEKLTGKFNLYK